MPGKALVIDANILVRAVLGKRVREIIETYAEQDDCCSHPPVTAFAATLRTALTGHSIGSGAPA